MITHTTRLMYIYATIGYNDTNVFSGHGCKLHSYSFINFGRNNRVEI